MIYKQDQNTEQKESRSGMHEPPKPAFVQRIRNCQIKDT